MQDNLNSQEYNRLLQDQKERLKELACINQTTSILREGKRIEEALDISSRKLLQRFLDRHNEERDVFHDLMPFKVKEIKDYEELKKVFIESKIGRAHV